MRRIACVLLCCLRFTGRFLCRHFLRRRDFCRRLIFLVLCFFLRDESGIDNDTERISGAERLLNDIAEERAQARFDILFLKVLFYS